MSDIHNHHHDPQHLSVIGQRGPQATSGPGRQILYRCSACGQPWLQDGAQVYLRLEPAQLDRVVAHLEAKLGQLPQATCRLCSFRGGLGSFEIDEYGKGQIGYGINWEAAEPVGAHLQATILAEAALRRSPVPPAPDVITRPHLARAVLTWLSRAERWPCIHLLDRQEQRMMAQGNPPGHGMSGTERWVWKGALFQQVCPPLRGTALTVLAIALPPEEPLEVDSLVTLWQGMAALALEQS
jgi:hypothetical protein